MKIPDVPKLSICINTCCLGPRAREITGSHTFTPHALRLHALRHFIIPTYLADPSCDEVIVAGEYEEGEGYTYVHVPSRAFSCVDALDQRQAAFETSSGDLVVFHHDDHVLDIHTATRIKRGFPEGFAIVLPERRRHAAGGRVEILNNGSADGYIGGHCVVGTRGAFEIARWADVQRVFEWDVSFTRIAMREGLKAAYASHLACWDVEVEGEVERPVHMVERPVPGELV